MENRTANYSEYVTSSIIDYDYNTDLDGYTYPDNGNCGNLIHMAMNYGDNGSYAKAYPYGDSISCVDNPNCCHTTSYRVDLAYVLWNEYCAPIPQAHHIARHEMGHVFGLAHTPCSITSVMWVSCPQPGPENLATDDIDDVNAYY